MGLTKLGQYIEQIDIRNEDNKLGAKAVRGLSTQKQIIETKADLRGVNLSNYKVFPPGSFAFVPDTSRRGDKISLAYNRDDNDYLVSSISVLFKVSEPSELNSDYLFMFFNRPEFDRYARFNSWGSTREPFSWDDMCDIDIELPSLPVQEKYAAIYNSMLANQKSYERGLDDLKIASLAYIEKLRRESKLFRIGDYITPYNEKNVDGKISLEQGINIEKKFITPQRSNSNLLGRKIVRRGMFAYCTQLNNENVAIAYRDEEDCVVSSVYDVFSITKPEELWPDYLMIWLTRPEFGRFVYWASEGSSYEFLNYDNLADYRIPIPTMDEQKAIGSIYHSFTIRERINERLKESIKGLCPILIKGSLEEDAI